MSGDDLLMSVKRLNRLPNTKMGDALFHLLWFINVHRRLPSGKLVLSDMLYQKLKGQALADDPVKNTTDKDLAKRFLEGIIDPAHIIPTIEVLRTTNDIDALELKPNTILKPTHSSGQVIQILNDIPDKTQIHGELRRWLKLDYYAACREKNYRGLKPKIIVEPLVFSGRGEDYKLYVYRGKSKLGYIVKSEDGTRGFSYFDKDWVLTPYDSRVPHLGQLTRPKTLNLMFDLAEKIGRVFKFVRVDFISDGHSLFIGEITHCEGAARYPYRSKRHPYYADEKKLSEIIFGEAMSL